MPSTDARRSAAALLREGAAFQETRSWGEAEARYRAAVRRDPRSAACRLKLGEVLIQQGRSAELGAALAPALDAASEEGVERFRLLMMAGRSADAFAAGETVQARDRSPRTALVLAWPWGLVWPDKAARPATSARSSTAWGPGRSSPRRPSTAP